MPLHSALGFENHPFAKTNADEEPHLSRYFIAPPFFDAVVGDSTAPVASVILAPRGGGKTAQRRMVEEASTNGRFLAVTYDRFEFGAGERVSDISLRYHLRNIITRVLVAYLSYLQQFPDLLRSLEKEQKRQLSLYAHAYLGGLTGSSLQELLRELKSTPEKFKEFWRANVGVMESLLNFLLRTQGLEAIDLPDLPTEQKKLEVTYKYQLESLLVFIRKLGYNSIYILVDKPDETEQTGNDPEATYRLIQPLIRDLELLGLHGFGFKFFLWDQVEPFYQADARPDRVPQYRLQWSRAALQEVLSSRLRAYSADRVSSFGSLLADDTGYNVDEVLSLLANGSPRNLIRLCEKIFAAQTNVDANSSKISTAALERGILEYCEEVGTQSYGEDVVRDMQRVGREIFTVNFIANDVFKFTQNAARNKITGWQKVGVISQIGTVAVESSKRPLNLYAIVDPAVVRIVHRAVPLKRMLADRWLPCTDCSTDNLVDIGLLPDGNDPLCRSCGRKLI